MFAERFRALEGLDHAPVAERQRRGYDFERFLHELLPSEGLDPRTSYKSAGEQIDGSFFLEGRTFLMEAKWQADSQAASEIYVFKGKVDGKLVGTLGVFVSMSGFSPDAINALTHGKDLNVILFDRADMRRAVNGDSFATILRKKLRAAAEQGLVYFDTAAVQVRRGEGTITRAPSTNLSEISSDSPVSTSEPAIIIVSEGRTDEAILQPIVSRLLDSERRSATVRFLVAGGSDPLPRLADAAKAIAPHAHILIVTDGDVRPATLRELKRRTEGSEATLLVVTPSLEQWLIADPALALTSIEEVRRYRASYGMQGIARLASRLDLTLVAQADQAFGTLVHILREHSSAAS